MENPFLETMFFFFFSRKEHEWIVIIIQPLFPGCMSPWSRSFVSLNYALLCMLNPNGGGRGDVDAP